MPIQGDNGIKTSWHAVVGLLCDTQASCNWFSLRH